MNAPSAMKPERFPLSGEQPTSSAKAGGSLSRTSMKTLRLMLRARGMDLKTLAWCIHSHRSHVAEVLYNKPGHGGQTRRKLAPLLLDAELALIGWDRTGKVLHGT